MKPIFPPSAQCKLRNQENCEYIYTTNYSTLSIFPPKTSFIFLFYNYLQDKLRISDILLFFTQQESEYYAKASKFTSVTNIPSKCSNYIDVSY